MSAPTHAIFACVSNVQIRDVPDDVLAALKVEAGAQGQSLQRYLLDLLTARARATHRREVLQGVAADLHQGGATEFDSVALLRRARDERAIEIDSPFPGQRTS